ncbi:MAG: indole-3-glycerol phosphate synthase TrpC [Propionibacteriaceae bacterium]|jgi:indole-3-glycerol phosphate synthase/phosphoribosylanthranilate isomerase|nr:indole-3-glycerol phosphate synthase TrpC [Propionibacteriaceae bacterium]
MNILETIATETRLRVADAKTQVPVEALQRLAGRRLAPPPSFEDALRRPGVGFICEVKKASPSKGVIAADFPYLEIAREYVAAGASAISVLTEPNHFLGSDEYLREIAAEAPIPVLRKDFVVDEYQIWQAATLRASAVLLIVALLDDDTLARFIALTHQLGMSALVEAHDDTELRRALAAGARIVGINNRDLTTFNVDLATSERLGALIPDDVLFVVESGLATRADVERVVAAGADAVLVGETLMRSADKRAALEALTPYQPKIKICGLRRAEDIAYVNAARPDFAGFVFAPSRRQVTPDEAAALRASLTPGIVPVGVFVDAEPEFAAELANNNTIDIIQLHGHEDASYVETLRRLTSVPIIRAVRLSEDDAGVDDLGADYLLLDSTAGSGETFDWALARADKPFFLAGGITPDNITEALSTVRPYAIDVSSGAETDGVKDATKIDALVDAVRAFGGASEHE